MMLRHLALLLFSDLVATVKPRGGFMSLQPTLGTNMLAFHWDLWVMTRDALIKAQQSLDVQCSYLPILQDQRKGYMEATRNVAEKYVMMAEELQKRFADFTDEEKAEAIATSPGGKWNIDQYQAGEMWTAQQTIFNNRYGRQCSHIYNQTLFMDFATRLNATVEQFEHTASFAVGTDWGMELDGRSGEVVEVTPGSPAAINGVRVGDFLWGIDGQDFTYRNYMWVLHIKDELKSFDDHFKFNGTLTFRRTSWKRRTSSA